MAPEDRDRFKRTTVALLGNAHRERAGTDLPLTTLNSDQHPK